VRRKKEDVIHAPPGYAFRKNSGTTLVKLRGNVDRIKQALLVEFKRCGFVPKNFKVIEVKRDGAGPDERGAFYLNFGYLRGLDPDEVYRLLQERVAKRSRQTGRGHTTTESVRRFPDNCGGRVIMAALARLNQRVEAPPALMEPSPV
jgi:hypothetical protein